LALPAIVAVTVQVPVPLVMETAPDESTVHAVDAPCDHVTVPAVDPPEADRVTVVPYVPFAEPEIVNVDWAALDAAMSTFADVA